MIPSHPKLPNNIDNFVDNENEQDYDDDDDEDDNCRAPLHEERPKHHGHKGDPGFSPGTSDAVGERAQVILVWVRALSVGNASHP